MTGNHNRGPYKTRAQQSVASTDHCVHRIIGIIARAHKFTPTERRLAVMMVQGISPNMLHTHLGGKRSTTKWHCGNLYRKLGASALGAKGRGGLIRLCMAHIIPNYDEVFARLTPCQKRVAIYAVLGHTSKETAALTQSSVPTIKSHRMAIMQRFDVVDILQLSGEFFE